MLNAPHRASHPGRERPDQRTAQQGQALAEYVLIVALIVVVALVALSFFGTQLSDILATIADTINP
jgi:Flp pilus assembly pilin Flp